MDPTARANFPAFLLTCGEGSTDWMYLDQHKPNPIVTIGYGNALFSLPQALRLDWGSASAAEVTTAWNAVVARPDLAPHGGGAFAALTTARATGASITRLIQGKIDLFEAELRHDWPGWDAAPGPAQEALMRMAWACGGRLAPHWPKLHAAWCNCDWAECANQCAIPALYQTEPNANAAEAELFRSAGG